MIKQGLEQKQTQKLSPLQIQTIKLIELPILDLEAKVRAELEENPVIDEASGADSNRDEESKDISIDELRAKGEDYIPAYRLQVNNWGKDARPEYNTFSIKESFTQNLIDQLGCRDLSPKDNEIAVFLIGSLDERGYLRRDIESVVDDLAFRAGVTTDEEEVERVLKIVQDLEPVGVGARDLRECLLLQLYARKQSPDTINATRILEECFSEFSNKHFQKIMTRMDISEDELKRAIKRIGRLNPAPGGGGDDAYSDTAQVKTPDFVLVNEDGKLSFTMPRFSIPEIRMKQTYKQMLLNNPSNKEEKEAITFVKQKYDSARNFIEALKQRQNTLTKTMQAILDYQYEYFDSGDEAKLKPMVLKDIAAITGFDISTISRVVSSKCIETYFGIYDLKYFFSEGMENKDGDEVSTREIKKALQELVDAEDKTRPLTDVQLVERLKGKGYLVARRTVAKYRGQLNIPLARLRKEL